MAYGDTDEFRILGQHTETTERDGTVVPHLEVAVYRNGVYRGYVELHTHRVKDDSISVGMTSRLETRRRPS